MATTSCVPSALELMPVLTLWIRAVTLFAPFDRQRVFFVTGGLWPTHAWGGFLIRGRVRQMVSCQHNRQLGYWGGEVVCGRDEWLYGVFMLFLSLGYITLCCLFLP